ncbi:hypothetical protein B0H63DRAFT_246872 [Podospora didyma]|uniref:magnesium chelatase n=1 Tax=Podospora didyma TaxID=330526 RepID=A0AAE0KLJ7_9PEZI|nr:hypothetical protein B0H63DRAFT_246872 [Podospora didyma]
MTDEQQLLLQRVHKLSDLELAALLSLVAHEHCLISTVPSAVGELAEELRLIATKTFNLTSAIVSCHAHTTLDDFATALMVVPSPGPATSPSSVSPGTNAPPRSVSPYQPRNNSNNNSRHEIHLAPSTSSPGYFSTLRPGGSSGLIPSSPSQQQQQQQQQQNHPHQPQIANVILAKDLDRAPRAVQIQALELLRTRRIFTRTSVQAAPKQFLFVAVLGAASGGQARVTPHLNDFFYIAHWHDAEADGFEHLDEEWGAARQVTGGGGYTIDDVADDGGDDDADAASTDSSQSVVKRGSALLTPTPDSNAADGWRLSSPIAGSVGVSKLSNNGSSPKQQQQQTSSPLFTDSDIAFLAQLGQQVHVDIDVTRYQLNIISFLRMHRAVAGGVSPTATKHFTQLMQHLAPLHGLDYATPSLVALAAKKVYLHRMRMVDDPEKERSMQWGSERAAVETLLAGIGPEDVIEDVLDMVAMPN